MAETPPHPPRYALTALLAPLGETAPDGRWLHPSSDWYLPAAGAPVLSLVDRTQVGVIRVLVKRQGWLIGLGYVDASERDIIEAMRADKLRPQIELTGVRTLIGDDKATLLSSEDDAHLDGQEAESGQQIMRLRFFGGTIRTVVAGDLPAFPDTRFTIGAHVEEDVDALGTIPHPPSNRSIFHVYSFRPDVNPDDVTDHGQTRDRAEAERLCREEVIKGALAGHVFRITPDPQMVYHYSISDL